MVPWRLVSDVGPVLLDATDRLEQGLQRVFIQRRELLTAGLPRRVSTGIGGGGQALRASLTGEVPGAERCRHDGAAAQIFFSLVRLVNDREDSVRCADMESRERSDGDPPHNVSTVGAS
jgi:hypothetical protein